jgi:ATP adenylyltransferase
MAYVSAEHGDEYEGPSCVFCDLPARGDDAATYILHRGERAFVIMNLYPYNNGHLMIVPYAHTDTIAALDEPTLTEMMMLARRSQAVLEERMRPQGFNIGVNQGRVAGAGIEDHLHVHVVPRWGGDTNFMPVLGEARVLPEALDATWDRLRSRLGD